MKNVAFFEAIWLQLTLRQKS